MNIFVTLCRDTSVVATRDIHWGVLAIAALIALLKKIILEPQRIDPS